MEKKELLNFLDVEFNKFGFKRKKNKWLLENTVLIKTIDIQKSQFGNYYYLNYGFIIKGIKNHDLENHISGRLASIDKVENKRIEELLDLDMDINDQSRKEELQHFLSQFLLDKLNRLNNDDDIREELKNRPHLNDIPLVVKKYFNFI